MADRPGDDTTGTGLAHAPAGTSPPGGPSPPRAPVHPGGPLVTGAGSEEPAEAQPAITTTATRGANDPPSEASDEPLATLRSGGKAALARHLVALEKDPWSAASTAILDAAWNRPCGHILGLTGPPGVGKSSLIACLVASLRGRGRSVGVIAVDPSSRRTGGSLLGDRLRIALEDEDPGVFVRSMAARHRLGGIADECLGAAVLFRALFDIVIIETVGVGQSETDIKELADSVVLAIQPASGDSLQYVKAGIVEIPDITVVTKADLGAAATRALRDLEDALALTGEGGARTAASFLVSCRTGAGIERLALRILERAEASGTAKHDLMRLESWWQQLLRQRYGSWGVERFGRRLPDDAAHRPFHHMGVMRNRLEDRLRSIDLGP